MKLDYYKDIFPKTTTLIVNEIKGLIDRLNPGKSKYIVVHSSMIVMRRIPTPVENTIRAFFEYADENDLTIFFPTFSLECCENGFYSPENTPCDTGILNDTVRKIKGIIRGLHPIDSYASYGKNKEVVTEFYGNGLHERGSAGEYFENVNALMIAWGTRLSYLTLIHHYEIISDVPYRYSKIFTGKIMHNDVTSTYRFRFKVKDFEKLDEKNSYENIHYLLYENIKFNELLYNNMKLYSANAHQIRDFLIPHFKKNTLAFLNNKEYFIRSNLEKA